MALFRQVWMARMVGSWLVSDWAVKRKMKKEKREIDRKRKREGMREF